MSLIDYHRKMLADGVRHEAFSKALKKIIKPGMTVADIGSGTGILSFLALKLGAKHATLYEMGDVLELSKKLAKENGVFDRCTFVHAHSTEVRNPEKADIVLSETLGNFALEEHLLEILQDGTRFLKPKGVMIPSRLTQVITPVIEPEFLNELQSWKSVGYGLSFNAAAALSLQNLYVRTFTPEDLLEEKGSQKIWDEIDFAKKESSTRKKKVSWSFSKPTSIAGFCLSWDCELNPGISLTTHPWDLPTHWEQIYLPVQDVLELQKGDNVELTIESDTRLSVGLRMKWVVTHLRAGKRLSHADFDMQKGFLA
jgi:protein arginine N-methyltransferase 1